jgi:MFS family permease
VELRVASPLFSAFRRFWLAGTISAFGSQITLLALPLTAVVVLHASPLQMGLLLVMGTLPDLLFGLVAGVWVDRRSRRAVMIVTDLLRLALLVTIPLAAWLRLLTMGQLYAVRLLTASCTVFFDIAAQSYLPAVVPSDELVRANSRLALSSSVAQLAGPGLGGALVQLVSAPTAILTDALSFLLSALTHNTIPVGAAPPEAAPSASLKRDLVEGLRVVAADRTLRSLAGASATFNCFDSVLLAVYVLYMARTLHIPPAGIGLVFGLGGIGGIVGALVAERISAVWGMGRTLLVGILVAALGELGIAFAFGPPAAAVVFLAGAEVLVELGALLFVINAVSLRQTATPPRLLGRVNASMRTLTTGLGPVGALAGGWLGGSIGLRPTVLLAGAGTLASLLWMAPSARRNHAG